MSIDIKSFNEVPDDQLSDAYVIYREFYKRTGFFLELHPWKEYHSSLYGGRHERNLARYYDSDGSLSGYSVVTSKARIGEYNWSKVIEATVRGTSGRRRVTSFSSMVSELQQSGFVELSFIEVSLDFERLCMWLQQNNDLEFFQEEDMLKALIDSFLSDHEVQIISAANGLAIKRDSRGRQDYCVYPMSDYANGT
ncbi:MAG: hypothetical protein KAT77_06565 [Nanoarchaeota archaeon]|nr:hypothetical protein [Nanoarchaeota archaeon]